MTPNRPAGPVATTHVLERQPHSCELCCWLCLRIDLSTADMGKLCTNPGDVLVDEVMLTAVDPGLRPVFMSRKPR